jgi:FkbM family methyltransferase
MFFEVIKTILKLVIGRGSVTSYSQFGEDALLNALTRGKKKGVYVDVGAFHPIQYSNTYLLYRRGWSGIAIDPNKKTESLFKLFRPRDLFHQTGIGREGAHKKYFHFTDPAYNTTNEAQAQEWETRGIKLQTTENVSLCPLSKILTEAGVTKIDVLSIDAEGSDMEILLSHDWNISTQIIVIEDHTFDVEQPIKSQTYSFLHTKGYMLYAVCGPSLIFKK